EDFSGPSLIEISSDTESGDIILICTDGIFSSDQAECTKDGFGDVWQKSDSRIMLFFEHLKIYFTQKLFTNQSLEKMLKGYLNALLYNKMIDDDATVGVVILPKVMDYQKNK